MNEFPHFTVSTMRVQRYDGTTRCLIDVCECIRWGGHETVSEQRKEQYSRLPVWWTTTRSTSLVFNEGVCVDNKKEGRSEKKKQNLNRYVVSDMHKDTKVIHEMTIVRKRGSTTDARSRRHCTGQATCLTVPYRLPAHQKLRGTACTSPKSYQKPL